MARVLLSAIILVALIGRAAADSSVETAPVPRSRLLVEILDRYGTGGHSIFCFVGLEVSRPIKYRRIALPQSFYARFVDGQFDRIRFNLPGCPTPENTAAACEPSCGLITVFDFGAWGYPPLSAPWPSCASERITFTRSRYPPPDDGIVMGLNVHHEWEPHHHLTIVEIAPCAYLVHEQQVIE